MTNIPNGHGSNEYGYPHRMIPPNVHMKRMPQYMPQYANPMDYYLKPGQSSVFPPPIAVLDTDRENINVLSDKTDSLGGGTSSGQVVLLQHTAEKVWKYILYLLCLSAYR